MLNKSYRYLVLFQLTFAIISCEKPHTDLPVDNILEKSGVIHEDPSLALKDTYYLFNSGYEEDCQVFDGNTFVHSFRGVGCKFFPGGKMVSYFRDYLHVINADGSIAWKKKIQIHHDIDVSVERGEIAALTSIMTRYGDKEVHTHTVDIYSFDGELLFRWDPLTSLNKLKNIIRHPIHIDYDYNPYEFYNASVKLNSVQILPENNLAAEKPFLKPGNILVNIRNFPVVVILDRDTKEIVWSHNFSDFKYAGVHSAKLTPAGELFYFRNMSGHWVPNVFELFLLWKNAPSNVAFQFDSHWSLRGHFLENPSVKYRLNSSSVEKYSMREEKVVWKYEAPATSYRFYTPFWGYSEPLPNGNVLITHLSRGGGSAFELTPDKQIVWEWINPKKSKLGHPVATYQVIKVKKDLVEPFLKDLMH